MKVQDFIGKVVVSTSTRKRYVLYQVTAPEIKVRIEQPDKDGKYTIYSWKTINGDPFSNGLLEFEDVNLTESFITFYKSYCRTQDAYWEEYGYWMRMD